MVNGLLGIHKSASKNMTPLLEVHLQSQEIASSGRHRVETVSIQIIVANLDRNRQQELITC